MDEVEKRTKSWRSVLELMRRNAGDTSPVAAEGAELFNAFIKIKDAGSRREVIDLAKRLSSN